MVIYGVIVRLHFITARQTSPPVAQPFFRLVNPSRLFTGRLVNRKVLLLTSGGVRLHFITARQTSPAVAQSFFRLVNPSRLFTGRLAKT